MVISLRNTRFWPILLFLVCHTFSMAQDPYFTHYTEDEELPSNEVYGLIQDADHIIYMATDRGLVAYDGYSFKTFTVRDGLGDNCILRMNKDQFNRIWLTSVQNTCDVLEIGQISRAVFSDSLQSIDKHEHFVQDIFVTRDSQMFINFNDTSLYKVEDDNLVKYTDHLADAGNADLCIFQVENGYFWDLLKMPDTFSRDTSSLNVIDNKYYIKTDLPEETPHNRKELIELGKDEFIFSFYKRLFHIKNGKIVEERILDHEILSLFFDDEKQEIWIGTKEDGAWQLSNKSIFSEPKKYLLGKEVTSILIDHERNYWFAVRSDGVYRADNLEYPAYAINSSNPEDSRITAMDTLGEYLFFGTYSGLLFRMDKDNEIEQVSKYKKDGQIRRLKTTDKGTLLIFSAHLYEIYADGNPTGFKRKNTYPYAYQDLDDGMSLLSITPGIELYQDRVQLDQLNDSDDSTGSEGYMKVRQIFKASDGTLYLSSQPYGLFSWRPEEGVPTRPKGLEKYHDKRCTSFQEFRGDLVLSPFGYGVVIAGKDSLIKITKNSSSQNSLLPNLSTDIVDDLLVQGDSIIWAATNKGVNRIHFLSEDKPIYDVDIIDTKSGLPSNRVYSIRLFNNSIWAGTGKGLVEITNSFPEIHPLNPPVIEKLKANAENYDREELARPFVMLKSDYPYSLNLTYKTVSFHEPHEIYYHYILIKQGEDQEIFNSTLDLEIHFPNIDNGKYEFYIFASYEEFPTIPEDLNAFLQSDKVSQVKITIPPKFQDTPYFIILLLALLLIALIIIALQASRAIKTREHNKQRLLLAEKTALLAQMNPHFIFNSLNSIQHYIIEQDSENANLYLAKFSKLIRKILDNSKKRTILLKEEIDTLTLYLNLEKLRFEDNFDYKLSKSKDLDQYGIMLPPMLLQPFVENAIWHGIMPLRGKGDLEIKFQRVEQRMLVIIEDNGIGRVKSGQKKRIGGHVPTGVNNVTERIDLLNKMIKDPIHLNIIDLNNPDGSASGTRVEVSIPIQEDHE